MHSENAVAVVGVVNEENSVHHAVSSVSSSISIPTLKKMARSGTPCWLPTISTYSPVKNTSSTASVTHSPRYFPHKSAQRGIGRAASV